MFHQRSSLKLSFKHLYRSISISREQSESMKDHRLEVVRTIVQAIQNGDARQLREHIWWPLQWIVPARYVEKIFTTLTNSTGPIQSFESPQIHSRGTFPTYKTLVQFEKCQLGLMVRVSPKSKVIGFSLHPPIKLGLGNTWQPPDYIKMSSVREEQVSFRSSWFWPKVEGTLHIPNEGKHRMPALLMLTGSGDGNIDMALGSSMPFKDLSLGLATAGIVTLRMNKPVYQLAWKSMVTKTMTVHDEYIPHNLEALRYLANHPDVDPSRIFVAGASLGGRVAPLLCANSSVPVAGIVLWAGSSRPLLETILRQTKYLQSHFPKPQEEFARNISKIEGLAALVKSGKAPRKGLNASPELPMQVPRSYLIDWDKNDPVDIAKSLGLPMLIMQGRQDWQVTVEDDFTRWQEGLRGSKVEGRTAYKLYDNVDHLMIEQKADEKGPRQYDEPSHAKEEIVRDTISWILQGESSGAD